jgi:Arc/MetJ family transcription regulator
VYGVYTGTGIMALARLNVELDTDLLGAAVEVSGARSKREAIEIALRELVRRHRLAGIVKRAGTVTLGITVDDLLRMREEE